MVGPCCMWTVLDIEQASILGLVGPNGSGKSTLLKLMAFVQRPSEGRIIFDGVPSAPFDESVRFQVTLLTQEPYLMKRSVVDNIAYGLKVRGDKEDRAAIGTPMPWPKLASIPIPFPAGGVERVVSGGEAQRVALAAPPGACVPGCCCWNEPTASVDASLQ